MNESEYLLTSNYLKLKLAIQLIADCMWDDIFTEKDKDIIYRKLNKVYRKYSKELNEVIVIVDEE